MAETYTVTDRRTTDRARTAADVFAHELGPGATVNPGAIDPNDNEPAGTVGAQFREGEVWDAPPAYLTGGGTPPVMPWDGWGGGWNTPPWNTDGGTGEFLDGFAPVHRGGSMSRRLTTVWSCTMANARPLAMMPPGIQKDSTPMPWAQYPAWLRRPPHPLYASWADFVVAAMISLQIRGEAFVVAEDVDSDEYPTSFYVEHPDKFEIQEPRDRRSNTRVYVLPNGDTFEVGPSGYVAGKLLHLRYATVPGAWHGQGPLQGAASAHESALALQRYGRQLATKGGVPWGVINSPDKLGKGQIEQLQSEWRRTRARADGAPAVMSGGISLQTLTLSPRDMALLDLRTFDEQRIASAFGVPSVLVGLPEGGSMTYSSTTMLADWHWRSTLRWLSVILCSGLSNWALPGQRVLTLNSNAYTAPDLESQVRSYVSLHTAGIISTDEVRTLLNFGQAGADVTDLATATNDHT